MDLAAYLSKRKIKPAAFAAEIGVPPSTISRIMRGERDPRGATIRKIVDGSRGEITPGDLIAAALNGSTGADTELPRETPCPDLVGVTSRDAGKAA